MSLQARALRLLAGREHSKAELRSKLRSEATAEEIDAMLARLEELGLQSDERFAGAYVRARAQRLGWSRLRYELGQRGVAADLIEAALAQMLEEGGAGDEGARAREVWARKFGQLPADAREWGRQARFLQSRGFSSEVIRKVLKEVSDESA